MTLFVPAIYVLVPATATILALFLAYMAWHRRPAPGATPFTAVFIAAAVWSFAYTMELLSTGMSATLFWSKTSYFGIGVLPTAWLLFALDYCGYEWWSSPSTLTVLAVEPVAVIVLVWTYPTHELVWTVTTPITFGGMTIIEYQHGPVFWAATAYSYLLLSVGVVLLMRRLMQVPARHRKRIGAILAGTMLSWFGNVLFNAGISPTPPLNLTHIGFAISGFLFFWVFFHYGTSDFERAVQEQLFESSDAGVVLLDPNNEVVDLNPAAEEIIGIPGEAAVGRPLDALLSKDTIFASDDDRIYNDKVVLEIDGESRRFDLDFTSVYYPIQQQVMGRVVVFREPSASC